VQRTGLIGDIVGFEVVCIITSAGAAKPSEFAAVAWGEVAERLAGHAVRLELLLGSGEKPAAFEVAAGA
jgi:hypothetical protein